MHTGKYVFSQISFHLPARVFDRCVDRYKGNRYVKHFTCWNQLLCMMFGQLCGRDSLRDLLVSISPHKTKFYHLGFGKNVTRSNLQLANEQRDYRIFEEFAYAVIDRARACSQPDADFALDIANPVYAFDSTLIDLCLSAFWWAEFRTTKAAVKIHTLIDVKTSIPCFVHITDGATHDVHGLDTLKYEKGGFYVLDRGYVDFERLFKINQCGAYSAFVGVARRPVRRFTNNDFCKISIFIKIIFLLSSFAALLVKLPHTPSAQHQQRLNGHFCAQVIMRCFGCYAYLLASIDLIPRGIYKVMVFINQQNRYFETLHTFSSPLWQC